MWKILLVIRFSKDLMKKEKHCQLGCYHTLKQEFMTAEITIST
jgi:hypothetical protein